MSSELSPYGSYISATVLSGIGITPLAILWFISFCVARRKGDRARVGVTWVKVVYPFWLLALIFFTVRNVLFFWMWFDIDGSLPVRYTNEIQLAMQHLTATALFFEHLADTFLFITFVELANGFMLCVQGPGEPSKMRKFSRIAAFVWGFVLVAVALGLFGASNAHIVRLRGMEDYSTSLMNSEMEKLVRDGDRLTQLQGALTILFWLTTIPAIVLASFAQHKARLHGIFSSTASLLLAATVLTFVRQLVNMAIYVHLYLAESSFSRRVPVEVNWVVQPFFDCIFMMIVLILLFALAARKRRGLWSQPPAESNYPAVVYVMPDGQPMQGAPIMQQQQQYQPYPQQYPQQQQQQQQHQQYPPHQVPMPQQNQQQPGGMPAYLQFAEQQKQQQQQQAVAV